MTSIKLQKLSQKLIFWHGSHPLSRFYSSKVLNLNKSCSGKWNWKPLSFNASLRLNLLGQTSPISMEAKKQDANMSGDKKTFDVDYNELVKAQRDENVLIVDVREDNEIAETGKLPGSIHIPMGKTVQCLTNLSNEEFKEKYQKLKPTKNTKIIFSCRSGKRSGMVQEDMQKSGYHNVYNYTGGWLDWESKTK